MCRKLPRLHTSYIHDNRFLSLLSHAFLNGSVLGMVQNWAIFILLQPCLLRTVLSYLCWSTDSGLILWFMPKRSVLLRRRPADYDTPFKLLVCPIKQLID
jgi:hypothetical protein